MGPALLVALALALSSAQPTPGCQQFSKNKIDYHDANISVVHNISNEGACCAACAAHNAARLASAPAATNCSVGVWYGCGPSKFQCVLKATTDKPFVSVCVVAMQPIPKPPTPAPTPIRFASIYTDHAVLQSAPARAFVWGFANVAQGEEVSVVVIAQGENRGTTIVANLSSVPSYTPQAKLFEHIWSAKLPAVPASFLPYNITVMTGLNSQTISDVLWGDVWTCGGQSNMYVHIHMQVHKDIKSQSYHICRTSPV